MNNYIPDSRIREIVAKHRFNSLKEGVRMEATVKQALAEERKAIADWLEEEANDSRLSGMSYTYGVNGLVKKLRDR